LRYPGKTGDGKKFVGEGQVRVQSREKKIKLWGGKRGGKKKTAIELEGPPQSMGTFGMEGNWGG